MPREGAAVLTEPCEADGSCNADQQLFKGIFAANLAELHAASGARHPYGAYLEQNAASAYARARGWGDFYDVGWAGPFAGTSLSKQASAVGLLVGLI